MSYLVLARKYRPASFQDVTGQAHVTQTLTNSIKRDKVAHAYLLCGPRGVGKTSIARIFAKSLNCEKGPTDKPCLKCQNCQEISAGNSIAVREIDGASHNSVDNVRELIDSFRTMPPPGSKYKVYIIDEVHMLSTAAFNALLKSLEEPPPNTVFILATTEAHKILPTVISRCQRFDLRALPMEDIENSLKSIIIEEKVEVAGEVIRLIARLSEGSLRDAQSLLERVLAFTDGKIDLEQTSSALGVVSKPTLLELSKAVLNRDSEATLRIVNQVFASGLDPVLFLNEFVTHWRELLIAGITGKAGLDQMDIDPDLQAELIRQTESTSKQDLQDLVELARTGADQALRSNYLKYSLEALLVRMSSRVPVVELTELLGSPSNISSLPLQTEVQKKKPEPELKAKVAPVVEQKSKKLDWRDFVNQISSNGQPVLSEHLRRLSIAKFAPGEMSAQAPEFTVKYFEEAINLNKLKESLNKVYDIQNWQFNFTVAEGEEFVPGSIQAEDHQSKEKQKADRITEIMGHPQIKAIKKVFPGSEVEELELKTGK